MKTGNNGLLATIFQRLRRLSSALKEKPVVVQEDYVLEHFMLYHGLIGTTPENQPDYRDVKADIIEAATHKSSVEMAIALKIAPLIWSDRLEEIITHCQSNNLTDNVIACLLPAGDLTDKPPEYDPLQHPDWRVQANAAKLLAFLQVQAAIPRLIQALNQQSQENQAAFCHIAYALSSFNTPAVRDALLTQLQHENTWMRVDAIGALANWPLSQVNFDLMNAMLDRHELSDYAAVAITKKHSLQELLAQTDPLLQNGALEVIIGLTDAYTGTFANDTSLDSCLLACLPSVLALNDRLKSPRAMHAALILSRWTITQTEGTSDLHQQAKQFIGSLQADSESSAKKTVREIVLDCLQSPSTDLRQTRHAIELSGALQIKTATPYIVPLLEADHPLINESLAAIAILGADNATDRLTALIDQVVSLDERTGKTLSKQAVFEDNPPSSRIYWHALKALGHLPDDKSVSYLLKATEDFAADKRQQAIESLLRIAAAAPPIASLQITPVIKAALADPSAAIKVIALQGIGDLQLTGLVDAVIKLTASKESGVARQAFKTLQMLATNGQRQTVVSAIETAMPTTRDSFVRQKLLDLKAQL